MEVYKEVLIPGTIIIILDLLFFWFRGSAISEQIESVQGLKFNIKPIGALLFYPLLLYVLHRYVLKEKKDVLDACQDAVLLGILLFGAIEFNNYALLTEWKLETVMIDTLWGGILLGVTTLLTYQIGKYTCPPAGF